MIYQLFSDLHLEFLPFVKCQTIALRNDRNNVDNFAQFFHHNNVDGTERMASGTDEVEATMNACVLNVAVPHSCQFFAKVCRMLVLDVFDNRVPTTSR